MILGIELKTYKNGCKSRELNLLTGIITRICLSLTNSRRGFQKRNSKSSKILITLSEQYNDFILEGDADIGKK